MCNAISTKSKGVSCPECIASGLRIGFALIRALADLIVKNKGEKNRAKRIEGLSGQGNKLHLFILYFSTPIYLCRNRRPISFYFNLDF